MTDASATTADETPAAEDVGVARAKLPPPAPARGLKRIDVIVGIVALLVGLVVGFQLGRSTLEAKWGVRSIDAP